MTDVDPGPGRASVASGAVAALNGFASDERLLVICGSTVLVMAGQGMVGPVLPLFARDFGVSAAVVGLTFTAFGLARLLLNIPAGIWADRRGRRFLLVGGPLITSIGMLGSVCPRRSGCCSDGGWWPERGRPST